MRNVLLVALSLILFIATFLFFEYNFRVDHNELLAAMSPVQWMVVLMLGWLVIAILNVIMALNINECHNCTLEGYLSVVGVTEVILFFIPITQIIVLGDYVIKLLRYILNPVYDSYNKEFEEEFAKDTSQSC